MKKYHFVIIVILLSLWISVFAGKKVTEVYPSSPENGELYNAIIEFPADMRIWYAQKQDRDSWAWPPIPELRTVGRVLLPEDPLVKSMLAKSKAKDVRDLKSGHLDRYEYHYLSDFVQLPLTLRRFTIRSAVSSRTVKKVFGKIVSHKSSPWMPLCYIIVEDSEHVFSAVNPDLLEMAFRRNSKDVMYEMVNGDRIPILKASLKQKYCGYPDHSVKKD